MGAYDRSIRFEVPPKVYPELVAMLSSSWVTMVTSNVNGI